MCSSDLGFFDKVKGDIKKMGSKRSEKADIRSLQEEIKEESRDIDEATVAIGEFYWNLYADGKFAPLQESQEHFDSIKRSLVRLEEINAEIAARQAEGEIERETIEEDIARQEEERQRLADERARKRAEERLRQAEERARMREAQGETRTEISDPEDDE